MHIGRILKSCHESLPHLGWQGIIFKLLNELTKQRHLDIEINRVECIWIQVKLTNNKIILYGVFYRPTGANSIYLSP